MNPLPKPKVLIVDDEEDIVTNLEAFLEEEGYEVLTAQDGETALKKIEEETPDLILLDLNIPKMSGFQILERISATNLGGSARQCGGKPKETGLKVLIFSGVATEEDKARALALGAAGYLNKPVLFDTLLKEIERVTVQAKKE